MDWCVLEVVAKHYYPPGTPKRLFSLCWKQLYASMYSEKHLSISSVFHSPRKSCQHLDYGSSLMGLLISALFSTRLLTLLKCKSDPISFFKYQRPPISLKSKNQCHYMTYEALWNLLSLPTPYASLFTGFRPHWPPHGPSTKVGRLHLGASVINVPSTQNAFI